MTDFLVRRDDLRECRIDDSAVPEPGPGEARLRVDRFGLTANNVTYAVFGEHMSYWEFFPAETGWDACRCGASPRWIAAKPTASPPGRGCTGTSLRRRTSWCSQSGPTRRGSSTPRH